MNTRRGTNKVLSLQELLLCCSGQLMLHLCPPWEACPEPLALSLHPQRAQLLTSKGKYGGGGEKKRHVER